MKLPVCVIRTGTRRFSMTGEGHTFNISSSGVLFKSDQQMDEGGPIEYLITLNSVPANPVTLRCMGKVIRTENLEAEEYRVAATLERYEFVRMTTALAG